VFAVQGYINGVSYTVQVGGDPTPSALNVGVASGSTAAMHLLREHEGEDVLASPTGPLVHADYSDPQAVVAVLLAYTRVSSIDGDDVPDTVTAEADVVH
jgi:hypothetical protein